jgi:hypothetical protein
MYTPCAEAKLRGTKASIESATVKISQSKVQIEESRERIDTTKADGWALVTDVRADADMREVDRRADEERASQVCSPAFPIPHPSVVCVSTHW